MPDKAPVNVAASRTPHPDFPLNAENLPLSLKGRGEVPAILRAYAIAPPQKGEVVQAAAGCPLHLSLRGRGRPLRGKGRVRGPSRYPATFLTVAAEPSRIRLAR
jgi:hypothetical protein